MKYKCDRCLKEFTQKSNFDVHMNRKKQCQLVIKDENRSETHFLKKTHKNAQKRTDTAQKRTKTHKDDIKLVLYHNKIDDDNIIDNNINCEKCGQYFTRKDTLTRHLKKFCKNIQIHNNINNKLDILNDKLEQVIEENLNLKKQLVKSTKKNTIIKTNTNSNNITNNQIIQNQQNIN
jgi:hypothetical protein